MTIMKPSSSEFAAFSAALGKVLKVSKNDLNRLLAEEKKANSGKPKRGPKPKTSPSDHVSDSSDQNGF
jgi:hypothetical protein